MYVCPAQSYRQKWNQCMRGHHVSIPCIEIVRYDIEISIVLSQTAQIYIPTHDALIILIIYNSTHSQLNSQRNKIDSSLIVSLYLLQNPNPTLYLSLCELRESSNGQLWRTQQAHLSLRVVVTLHAPPLQTRRPTTASIPILRPTRIRPDPVPPDLLQPRPASLQGHPFPHPLRSPCPRHIRRWHLRHF